MCITEVSINGNKLKSGKNRDRHQFWLKGDENGCGINGYVSSAEVVIKNGVISQSACGMNFLFFFNYGFINTFYENN